MNAKTKKQFIVYLMAGVSLCLLYFVYHQINFLVTKRYIVECFSGNDNSNSNTNSRHTVDLPLTTTQSCTNFCGPTARCATSGQQCLSDSDCPGCQPKTNQNEKTNTTNVPGNDDAGKLTMGVTPTYSPLTNGFGTRERIITDQLYGKPSQANFGQNNWKQEFENGLDMYNQSNTTNTTNNDNNNQYNQFLQNYPPMYSLTGEFMDDGPLPSNY